MSFFGIIFYIVIIVIIINAKKATAVRTNEPKTKQTASPNVPETGRTASPNVLETGRTASPNVPETERTVRPNVPKHGKMAVPNVPVKKRTEKTFMEPHKEESLQPRIRTNNLWGEDEHANKRIVALRLMEGDPVPEGYVKIKCPYCAAENLVTKHCKQYHSCYFCRVPID